MSDLFPSNDLDRAVMAVCRCRAATPELYRRLGEGELSFLMPYHPENQGDGVELRNGMEMPFSQIVDGLGPVVPVFSSIERAQEAMEKFGLPPQTYSLGTMKAKVLLEILGKANLRAVINKGCKTGELTIPADLMRDLASGKVFQASNLNDGEPEERQTLKVIAPADYPTDLLQPLFETLKRHRNFRASWILGYPNEEMLPVEGRRYHLLVLMKPRNEVIFHELMMVLGAVRTHFPQVESGLLDEKNTAYIHQVFASAEPFFTATGFRRPRVSKK